MADEILAIADRASNATLMVECAQLGYLPCGPTDVVLDLTYGYGTFWREIRPAGLRGTDIDPDKSQTGASIDFTSTPYPGSFADAVVLDPPYKLNGTPIGTAAERYGVHRPSGIAGRHSLMAAGITEAARILKPGGHLLFKCQDQVASGRVWWQTHMMAAHAAVCGLDLVDSLLYLSYWPQPPGRRQIHARRNYSTLLILRRI